MKKKIYLGICLVSVCAMLITAAVSVLLLYKASFQATEKELRAEADFLAEALRDPAPGYPEELGKKTEKRITLTDSSGTVLYDSYLGKASLPNHLDRPEIAQALREGSGYSTRRSDSLGKQTYYYALKLEDGTVLRLAETTDSILSIALNTLKWLVPLLLLLTVLTLFLSRKISASLVRPINTLDLDDPLNNDTYEELSPLLRRLEKQNRRIEEQLRQLSEKQQQFDRITAGMSEGLILLSSTGMILSANKSALAIFGAEALPAGDGAGPDYPALCRNREYTRAVEAALHGRSASARLALGSRSYRLSAGSVPQENAEACAAVLLIADETEKENAEAMRREFTANVSHELKTPLASIMGYGELIENQLAKPEDVTSFAGKIRQEAGRLLTLIEDIIELSQLDEGIDRQGFESVDLRQTAEEVLDELQRSADQRAVFLRLDGAPCFAEGNRRILHEILFNLCDNAIKYNRPGGHVRVSTEALHDDPNGHRAAITVADDGIGIPEEEQPRVFERFYRVDKSHSKQTGGTGLGLSIVKHAVLLHGGDIRLKSRPGEGTEITVLL